MSLEEIPPKMKEFNQSLQNYKDVTNTKKFQFFSTKNNFKKNMNALLGHDVMSETEPLFNNLCKIFSNTLVKNYPLAEHKKMTTFINAFLEPLNSMKTALYENNESLFINKFIMIRESTIAMLKLMQEYHFLQPVQEMLDTVTKISVSLNKYEQILEKNEMTLNLDSDLSLESSKTPSPAFRK